MNKATILNFLSYSSFLHSMVRRIHLLDVILQQWYSEEQQTYLEQSFIQVPQNFDSYRSSEWNTKKIGVS